MLTGREVELIAFGGFLVLFGLFVYKRFKAARTVTPSKPVKRPPKDPEVDESVEE